MDIATVIGLLLGIGLVLGSIMMGGSIVPFINIPSLMITVGGSIAAILINFPLGACLGLMGVIKKCFLTKVPEKKATIEQFKEFSSIVRKEGLLALESKMEEIDDDFLKRGLEMVVAGGNKDDVQHVLENEVTYVEQRHQQGKKMVEAIAAAAPAFGMIGTLIGLVQMLRALDDPSQIGVGMATALLTTLYGALIANLFCLPLAGKLEARAGEESMIRELIVEGLLSLVDGQSPRAVEERLGAFVAPKIRETAAAA